MFSSRIPTVCHISLGYKNVVHGGLRLKYFLQLRYLVFDISKNKLNYWFIKIFNQAENGVKVWTFGIVKGLIFTKLLNNPQPES